jgi:hypothetical protein
MARQIALAVKRRARKLAAALTGSLRLRVKRGIDELPTVWFENILHCCEINSEMSLK